MVVVVVMVVAAVMMMFCGSQGFRLQRQFPVDLRWPLTSKRRLSSCAVFLVGLP